MERKQGLRKIACMLTLFVTSSFAAWGDTPQKDALWLGAVEVARRTEESRIVPLSITIHTAVRKRDGSVDHVGTVVLRAVDGGGHELDTEIVSAFQDGKDVTNEAKKAEAESRQKRGAGKSKDSNETIEVTLDYHPFSPKSQERVAVHAEGETTIGGRRAALFTFRHSSQSGKAVVQGKAWLDLETGTPIQVEASPDPLPRFVTRMVTTASFQVTPDGLWQPKSSTISGEGGFLFYHRIVESSATFSNFGPWPGGGRKE